MSAAPASDTARIRAAATRAWTAYRELWRKGRMGIAVALLIPCFACWLCSAVATAVLPDAPTPTPRPTNTARPSRTPAPTRTTGPTRTAPPPTKTDAPPTVAPATAVPALPTEAPPAAPAQIQPLLAVPPEQPAAPPPQPAAELPRRGSPQGGSCPAGLPIKGNADSMIYHVPGGGSYDATDPEECFATEADAVAAGYRRSKR